MYHHPAYFVLKLMLVHPFDFVASYYFPSSLVVVVVVGFEQMHLVAKI